MIEKQILSGMGILRIISGLLEIATAIVILRLQKVETALQLNALLGLIGPIIFLLVSALGLVAVAVKVSSFKICLIILGVIFTLLGTRG
ncbi:MAG TPA: DUF2619 domain-containing protein [Firmicutes bacterium]|nr:DUF2619 domain-containing protein [Bacillota bacterium]HBK68987.1 DUF2619 domain-containing protein [Bacillota bacterium]HBT18136.1 DUF2619 domain-containing protein [Bacillota bacterium]